MNLQELTSPLPKPWLNISANTLNTNILNADTVNANSLNVLIRYSTIDISHGPASTNNGTGTLNITPANLVSGILGANGAATLTVQLPSAAAINTYLGPLEPAPITRFQFISYTSGAPGPVSNTNFLMGSGLTTFNGAANITVPSGAHKIMTFVKSGINWIIYS